MKKLKKVYKVVSKSPEGAWTEPSKDGYFYPYGYATEEEAIDAIDRYMNMKISMNKELSYSDLAFIESLFVVPSLLVID